MKNVSKSYYEKAVLTDIDLHINPGEKLAIIGENGTGKTTLFRLILGLEQPDSENAEITIAKNTIIGYLEQQVNLNNIITDALFDAEIYDLQQQMQKLANGLADTSARHTESEHAQIMDQFSSTTAKFESLGGYAYQYRLAEILAGLGIDSATAQRPVQELSGGEKMRVQLARLLIREPDVMLLDEPTNHLDHQAIEWLENFLQKTSSTVLLISHDRFFIDRIATRTAELSGGKLTIFPGNYSNFVKLSAEQQKSLNRSIDKVETELNKQTDITQTMFSHRKISSYRSSQKKEAIISQKLSHLKTKLKNKPTQLNIKILKGQDLGDPTRTLISTKDLYVQFPGRTAPLFQPFSWSLQGKQKIVVVGVNGCGKTTLLKSLLGNEPHAFGTVNLATDIKYGFLGQLIEFSDENCNVLESLAEVQPNWTEATARNELAKYGFRGIDVFKPLNTLSGGERSRLYLCHLLSKKPDVLFLDEPTNHLDINSCEILENALVTYEGSIIAVSHDRYFIEKIAQYILGFIGGTIQRFNNYNDFRRVEEQAIAAPTKRSQTVETTIIPRQQDISADNSLNENDNSYKTDNSKSDDTDDTNKITSQNKRKLWSKKEVRLEKSLNNLQTLPNNLMQTRRFKALGDETLASLTRKIDIAIKQKNKMESKFETATDPKIYVQYEQLLILIDQYESIYLKLAEILENFG
ncbi:MAG TPA: ABC-F family ATP-binding cassette domain-containing protein [Clostridiaceae bacterium]|nr:ABC-F family ATP-binding cassette domain-containing protein [Clostridiaceae bacterium]